MKRPHLKLKEKQALDEFTGRVRKELGKNLVKILLYGSKARGDSGRNSDIDVLVLVRSLTLAAKDRVLDATFDVNLKYDTFIAPYILPKKNPNRLDVAYHAVHQKYQKRRDPFYADPPNQEDEGCARAGGDAVPGVSQDARG